MSRINERFKYLWVDKDRNVSYELINNMKLEIEYAEVK